MTTPADTAAEPLVLPIGQFFGTFYHTVGTSERVHHVRLDEVVELDDNRFAVWAVLHGVPDRLPAGPWTRTAVRAAIEEMAAGAPEPSAFDVTQVDDLLDGLLDDGLATEVVPGTDGVVEFARANRMRPRMLGLGNSQEEPWLYTIGFFEHPVVKVTREVYNLWEEGELADSLWAALESLAGLEREAGVADPVQVDPVRALDEFITTVHNLLAMSVVYFEPTR